MPNYQDPGVYISEITGPILATTTIAPTVIALVGDSQRYRTFSEVVQLNGTTPIQLSQLGINSSTLVITDRFTGTTYTLTVDYTTTSGSGADAVPGNLDDTLSISRAGGGNIADGTYVVASYQYTDPTYYGVYSSNNYNDVVSIYGNPLDSSGNIISSISLAAFLAFTNGATQVYTVAVQAATSTPTTDEWQTTLNKLNDVTDVNVIVPVTGSQAVHALVQQQVINLANVGVYRSAFIGRDGTLSTVTANDLSTQAATYSNSRISLIGPATFNFFSGQVNGVIPIGGQYAAAAVAGVFASQRVVSTPITRKRISGLYNIPNQLTNANIIQLQSAGVCVIWQNRQGQIIVKHGLTTDMTNVYTQEISVQAAKDRLRDLIVDTLDGQGLIGSVMTVTTPDVVVGAVVGALEQAQLVDLIFGYSNVQYRIPSGSPTTIQIQFQYQPSMPLNYINIEFGIDTDTGTLAFTNLTTQVAA